MRLARYTEARRRLEEAVAAMPDQPAFIHALARVLAASPVEGVRDGERALAMLAQLVQSGQHDPDLAETIAMALAETGDFAKAAEWQQQAVAAANEAGAEEAARRMEQRLAAYRDGRAWREPWSGDDPLHFPPRDAVPAQPQRGPFSG